MKKRVGFLIDSLTYFKIFGPVIGEALGAGLDVHLLLRDDPEFRKGPKGYQWPDPCKVPTFAGGAPQVRQWESDGALIALCRHERIDVVISVWLYPRDYALRRALRDGGTCWIALQHGVDHLIMPLETLTEPDVTCMFSPFWVDHAVGFFAKSRAGEGTATALASRLRATGFPELDAFRKLDPGEIRRRYGVPDGRPVVVWLPHDHHADDPWEVLVFRRRWRPRALVRAVRDRRWDLIPKLLDRVTVGQVARSLRAFCDRNRAFLLVKSRIKDRPSVWDRRVADLFTFDRGYHPPTILEALAIADLCVHVLSVAAMEAAYAGVPALCLIPPEASTFVSDPDTAWRRTADNIRAPDTLWNFAGVSFMLPLEDAVTRLPETSLEEFRMDPVRRDEYVRRYVGPTDGRSSRRVLRAALDVVGEQAVI